MSSVILQPKTELFYVSLPQTSSAQSGLIARWEMINGHLTCLWLRA